MNIIDVIIILLMGISIVTGYHKGILQQAVMFAGTILVYVSAFFLKNPVADLFFKYAPFFKFAGDIKGIVVLNVIIYQLIAFILVAGILFSIFGIVVKTTGILQKAVDMTVILTIPSKIGGAIVGFFEGYIILFLLLTVLIIPLSSIGLGESVLANKIIYESPLLTKSLGGIGDAIHDIFTLVGEGYDEGIAVNQMNLDTMDALLKYNVIKPESAQLLIDNNKLESVQGIQEIVNKYKGE